MPITKRKNGYYWGSKGPFKTKKKAQQVAQAAYASGYVKKGWKTILKKEPRKGTGKKPQGSTRRLYTDENPKDTVRISYKTPTDARATVAKVKRISKPFARKIQILTVMEQRAKVAGKTEQAAIAKRGKEAIRKKHGTQKKSKKS